MLATALFLPFVVAIFHAPKSVAPIFCAQRPYRSSLRRAPDSVRRGLPYHFGGYESSRWSLVVGVAGDRKFGLAWLGEESARVEFGEDAWQPDSRGQSKQRGVRAEDDGNFTFSSAPVIACDWLQTLCARDTTLDLTVIATGTATHLRHHHRLPLHPPHSSETCPSTPIRNHGCTEQAGKDGKLRAQTVMAMPGVDGHS